jgi:hypothetical protein
MKGAVFAALALWPASALAAEPFYDELALHAALFGKNEAYVCFSRSYDAAHLKAHPQQKATSVVVLMRSSIPDDPDYLTSDIWLRAKFATRGAGGSIEHVSRCTFTSSEGGASVPGCASNNPDWIDDGPMLYALEGADALIVKLPPRTAYKPDPEAFGDDDRVFRLARVPITACPLSPPVSGAR